MPPPPITTNFSRLKMTTASIVTPTGKGEGVYAVDSTHPWQLCRNCCCLNKAPWELPLRLYLRGELDNQLGLFVCYYYIAIVKRCDGFVCVLPCGGSK